MSFVCWATFAHDALSLPHIVLYFAHDRLYFAHNFCTLVTRVAKNGANICPRSLPRFLLVQ